MLHMFSPTIEAFHKNSPEWYKQFHSSFYLSQLINNLLLSYLTSFIERNQFKNPTPEEKDELIRIGAIKEHTLLTGEKVYSKNEEIFYSVDIKIGLQELIDSFKNKRKEITHNLMCAGIKIDDKYINKNVDIDFNDLLEKAGEDNWYMTVKGFLNTWEFLFIFSITESALKNKLGLNLHAKKLIPVAFEKHPNIEEKINEKLELSTSLSTKLWELFVEIRNLYSHTHGILKSDDRKKLVRFVNEFKEQYDQCFADQLFFMLYKNSDELFQEERFRENKFFFLRDDELNLFRNFITELMYLLSLEDK